MLFTILIVLLILSVLGGGWGYSRYGYAAGWNAFKRLAAGASAEEKADLFWRTATRFYRLP